ncbi:MAG TPA: Gfo/Idh/MocA family oxidoreductase [Ktedonobacteraceae bacterium]|nr:Gfo/Idh/MocA family oxidoreductase [Ktedonobacteraceae bacterium]
MTLRLVQVGLGNWGQNWFREVVTKNELVEPVAWVEIDAKALDAAQHGLNLPPERCFLHIEDALEHVEADAVLVTASLPGHVPATRAALQAKKHVLLEKPFVPTMAEGLELVGLAAQQDRILMISQNYRFYPAVQRVRELVRDQVLGPISSVSIDFRRFSNRAPVEHRHYHIWHPLLADMSIHHFDLLRAVLGQEPRRVMCQTWNPGWSRFVQPPAASMMITFDGGTVVNYRGSWISQGPQTNWAGEWHMDCENGEIVWTSRGEKPDEVLMRQTGKSLSAATLPTLEARDRSGSLNAFVQACQAGEQPETSGEDNLKTIAFLFAAIESAEQGIPITVADPQQTATQQQEL